jgi:hypothetical protein
MTFEGYWPVNCFHDKQNRLRIVLKKGKFRIVVMYSRFLYENQLNEPLPENMEIHHLDFDRNNNELSNLVALTSAEHKKYHHCIDRFKSITAKYKRQQKIAPDYKVKEQSKDCLMIKKFRSNGKNYVLLEDSFGKFNVRSSTYTSWLENNY